MDYTWCWVVLRWILKKLIALLWSYDLCKHICLYSISVNVYCTWAFLFPLKGKLVALCLLHDKHWNKLLSLSYPAVIECKREKNTQLWSLGRLRAWHALVWKHPCLGLVVTIIPNSMLSAIQNSAMTVMWPLHRGFTTWEPNYSWCRSSWLERHLCDLAVTNPTWQCSLYS